MVADEMSLVLERLNRIEAVLTQLVHDRASKEYYTTDEVATILKKRPFTVREWCRLGRIHAEKRECGRGAASEWLISHLELVRIQNHGLLPSNHDGHY
jgi:Helix-turn-helix domain